jgi:hypothetical protein
LKKPDPVEQSLDRLAALKAEGGGAPPTAELKTFLAHRSNLMVSKAAKITGQARAMELVPELVKAFHRLMQNPSKLDKGCAATTEIVGALYELDYVEPEIYLLGIHHVQMEGSFGPPVDAAAKLRAVSALGLARTRYPTALDEVVSLLVDDWAEARIGAVRALATNGGPAGALLLKLKLLTGDSEPEVLAECFSGLLTAAPEKALPLISKFIDSEETAIAEAALLALGSSRHPEAFDVLRAKSERTAGGPLRRIVLLAIAMIRSDAAIEFLLDLLAECSPAAAKDVLAGLALFRNNEKIKSRTEALVRHRNEESLRDLFARQF